MTKKLLCIGMKKIVYINISIVINIVHEQLQPLHLRTTPKKNCEFFLRNCFNKRPDQIRRRCLIRLVVDFGSPLCIAIDLRGTKMSFSRKK